MFQARMLGVPFTFNWQLFRVRSHSREEFRNRREKQQEARPATWEFDMKVPSQSHTERVSQSTATLS